MIRIVVFDPELWPHGAEEWGHTWASDWSIPGGRWLGEWAWVGRIS